jgi:hypothetical protein
MRGIGCRVPGAGGVVASLLNHRLMAVMPSASKNRTTIDGMAWVVMIIKKGTTSGR